ncbi:MAG TPA: universal stress protein [Ilumatobacteraceae bacterium]|nr:universal stress protein [Ilumatobacteraceae bacterium]
MYASIVVGTDGSSTAEKAVAHAAQLAALSGAHLHIATVAPRIPVLVAPDMVVASAEWNEASDQSTQLALAGAAQIAERAGAAATTHALGGEPADALLSLCDEVDADLLVVGNRGMQGARRFLLGSVSSRCAHHADCSVLIVQTT